MHKSIEQVALVTGQTIHFADAELSVTADDDGVRLHAAFDDDELGEAAELEIIEGPGGIQGHLRTRDGVARLFDGVQLGQQELPTDQGEFRLVGLQGDFSFAHRGPFRRLRSVFLGTHPDAAVVQALVAAFDSEDHGDVARLPWTIESLTRFSAAHARSLAAIREVTVDGPGRLTVRVGKEGVQHVDLHNLFMTVRLDPEDFQAKIEAFFAAAVSVPSGPVANGDVMLRVLHAASPVTIEVSMSGETNRVELASVAIADDLSAVFVRDTPHNMSYLQASDIESLAGGPDELISLANDNLMRSLPAIHIRGEAPLFMIIAGGNYESSLPLHPAFWEAMRPLLVGSPLVAMPARDLCFVMGDRDPNAVAQLRSHIEGTGEVAYALSPNIYRVEREGRWFEALT